MELLQKYAWLCIADTLCAVMICSVSLTSHLLTESMLDIDFNVVSV